MTKATLTKRINKETDALNYFNSIVDLKTNTTEGRIRILSIIEQHKSNIKMLIDQRNKL